MMSSNSMAMERAPEDGHAHLTPRRLAEAQILNLVADATGIPEDEWQMIPQGIVEPLAADDNDESAEYTALAGSSSLDPKRPEVIYVRWIDRETGEYADFMHCPHEPGMRPAPPPEQKRFLSPTRMIAVLGGMVLVAIIALVAADARNSPKPPEAPLGKPVPKQPRDAPVFQQNNGQVPIDELRQQPPKKQRDGRRPGDFELRLP